MSTQAGSSRESVDRARDEENRRRAADAARALRAARTTIAAAAERVEAAKAGTGPLANEIVAQVGGSAQRVDTQLSNAVAKGAGDLDNVLHDLQRLLTIVDQLTAEADAIARRPPGRR